MNKPDNFNLGAIRDLLQPGFAGPGKNTKLLCDFVNDRIITDKFALVITRDEFNNMGWEDRGKLLNERKKLAFGGSHES